MHWAAALITAAAGVPAGHAASVLIGRLPGGPGTGQRGVPRLVPGMLTVTGFAAMGLRFGLTPVLPAYCYLAVLSVTLGFIDARCRRLPDVLTLSAYPAGAALLGAAAVSVPGGPRLLAHAMAGAALAGGLYLVLACLYPAGHRLGGREAVRGAGHVPRLARREGLRDRAGIPLRACRRQRRGDDRGRRRDQEEPHPVRPVHGRRSSGRDPGQSFPVPRDDRQRRPAGDCRGSPGCRVPERWPGAGAAPQRGADAGQRCGATSKRSAP